MGEVETFHRTGCGSSGPNSVAAAALFGVLLATCREPVAAAPLSLWPSAAAREELRATMQVRAKRRPPARSAAPKSAEEVSSKLLSRSEVLAADPDTLARIGRHLVIGYHDMASVRALVEKRAIAGIFITDHNVRRRRVADIKADIDTLQSIRAAQGLPPLLVAADQEGGSVSRLTPPLRRQTSLARTIAKVPAGGDVRSAVEAYARVQARELRRVGVTLNFSPVVDLKIDPRRRSDGETRLRHRALSADPRRVAEAAGWYCDTLAAEGVSCTIKHFPGLGRVTLDTHRTPGEIRAPVVELDGADWVPFRELMVRPHVVTMLGHVRLNEVDKTTPASFSAPVITGLVRTGWRHDGLLITDDFSMGAVTRSQDGVGAAAVKALNAGVDLLLLSFSDEHLNAVMTALIAADANGGLDAQARAASRKRLSAWPVSAAAAAAPAGAAAAP